MFDVGDGTRVRFWHDKWSGHYSLKDLYLSKKVSEQVGKTSSM